MTGITLALRHYLSTLPALTALVGTRIYPVNAPATTELPRVRYVRTSDTRERGLNKDSVRKGTARITLWLEGRVYDQLPAIEDALRGNTAEGIRGLDGLGGAFDPQLPALMGPPGSVHQVIARIDDARDNGYPDPHGSDEWTYAIELDLWIEYQPTGG